MFSCLAPFTPFPVAGILTNLKKQGNIREMIKYQVHLIEADVVQFMESQDTQGDL